MAQIFISYASEDREQAHSIALAFESRSWSVWWDRKIPAGESFDEVIEHEIERAECVVVLWSAHSTKSEWVKNEAASAVDGGKLIPIQIDGTKLPLEFRRRQTLSLVGWNGSTSSELLHPVYAAVSDKVRTQSTKASADQPSQSSVSSRTPNKVRAGILAISIGLVAVLFGLTHRGHTDISSSVSPSQQSASVLGTWKHYSGVTWQIEKGERSSFTIQQSDPDKGLTMRGTARQVGDTFEVAYEVLPEPVMKGVGQFTISQDGSEINLKYKHESGKAGSLVFRR